MIIFLAGDEQDHPGEEEAAPRERRVEPSDQQQQPTIRFFLNFRSDGWWGG